MSKVLRILSIVFASLSLISLFQHVSDVGFVSIFSDLITYYRNASQQLFSVFEFLFTINIPQAIKDLWLLSFIGGGAFIGAGILLSIFNPFIYTDSMSEEPQVLMRGAARNCFIVIIGVCAFFVLNAYALSV